MPKKKREEPGIPEWVVTYGDMMSLLLCFFILLAAFSELKQERDFQDVLKVLRESFGYTGGTGSTPMKGLPTNSTQSILQNLQARKDKEDSPAESADPNVAGREELSSTIREGSQWAVGGNLPFAAGSTDLTPYARKQIVEQIAPKLRDQRNVVRIVGHAWGIEDRNAAGSEYDLAFQRAKAVADLLINEGGVNKRVVRIVSAGDAEPADLAGTGAGATDANRRVQVILTEVSIDDIHPDPDFTGRSSGGGASAAFPSESW